MYDENVFRMLFGTAVKTNVFMLYILYNIDKA